jgi:hypothetical protein
MSGSGHDEGEDSGVTEVIREVGDHPIVEGGARLGYAVNGLLHLLIAWLAVQVAVGVQAAKADQSGALATLTDSTMGTLTLWAAVAGFALLGLWQLTEAVVRRRRSVRLKSAGKAIGYAAIGWSALGFLLGSGSDSARQSADVTAALLGAPLGRLLVAVLGLAVLGIAAYHVVKGWTRRFLRDLREHPGGWAVWAGIAGYVAKGIALTFVGGLFLVAAGSGTPDGATGLDGAMRALLLLPGGRLPLLLIGVGFAAYGVYSLARARFARV